MFSTPSNFKGDPYGHGLNQMGHFVLGAASMYLACLALPLWAATLTAGGVAVAWEVWQRKRKGSNGRDYALDLVFWLGGIWLSGVDWVMVAAIVAFLIGAAITDD